MEECPVIADIHSLRQSEAAEILGKIARVEKKTFPSNEAFDFNIELWRKKPNTRVVYMINRPSTVTAYLVYVRHGGVALLHKLCVVEAQRRKGFGRQLLQYLIKERLPKEGCQYVQLWVDKARLPARRLYLSCGFEEKEEVPNYYSEGRTGIRMVLYL